MTEPSPQQASTPETLAVPPPRRAWLRQCPQARNDPAFRTGPSAQQEETIR